MLALLYWPASNLLGIDSTSFAQIKESKLVHVSWLAFFNWFALLIAVFRIWRSISSHKCSIGFKSGLWAGHFNTVILLSAKYAFISLAVCLGSLSCWKMNPRLPQSFLADTFKFYSKIPLYVSFTLIPLLLPSINPKFQTPCIPILTPFTPPNFKVSSRFLQIYFLPAHS